MKVLILIILIIFLLKNIVREGYTIWKSNPYIRYGRYNIRTMKKISNNRNRKYTVVYFPNRSISAYNRYSGNYLKV